MCAVTLIPIIWSGWSECIRLLKIDENPNVEPRTTKSSHCRFLRVSIYWETFNVFQPLDAYDIGFLIIRLGSG